MASPSFRRSVPGVAMNKQACSGRRVRTKRPKSCLDRRSRAPRGLWSGFRRGEKLGELEFIDPDPPTFEIVGLELAGCDPASHFSDRHVSAIRRLLDGEEPAARRRRCTGRALGPIGGLSLHLACHFILRPDVLGRRVAVLVCDRVLCAIVGPAAPRACRVTGPTPRARPALARSEVGPAALVGRMASHGDTPFDGACPAPTGNARYGSHAEAKHSSVSFRHRCPYVHAAGPLEALISGVV